MPEEKKDELVHLTIDDIPVAVPPGTLVWAAAKQIGLEIPIYCYHPKMPPLGACRMCFVEIEKVPKPPQTACTTPVSEGMIVHTKTDKVLKARKGTLETSPRGTDPCPAKLIGTRCTGGISCRPTKEPRRSRR